MIIPKIAIIIVATVAMISAWSTQFPQIFRTFPPPPSLPQYRPFLQDPAMLQPRYYVHHQPQFRHPLHLYQPPPSLLPPSPPPQPPAARSPTPHDLPPQPVAGAADVHHHHHHHVFHYYYLPNVDGTTANGRNEFGRNVRQSCDLVTPVAGSPSPPSHLPTQPQPGYLPPPSPSPPTPTPTTAAPPAAAQPPCDNNDAVVVDNSDYFPFGRSPIVVTSSVASVTGVKDLERATDDPRQDGRSRQNFAGRQENRSNFILANYLLPPDK